MSRVNSTDVAQFRASGSFDEQWYVNTYPDVTASGIDPAEHYLWIGAHLGRKSMPSSDDLVLVTKTSAAVQAVAPVLARHSGSEQLDALFIDGTNGTSSTPYRVFRIANGLANEGWRTRCVKGEDLFGMLDQEITARFVIFHRAPFWSPYVEYTNKMRARGSVIVFDVDDLIFDEAVIPYIDGYRYLSEESQEGFRNGMRAYRGFIENADMCTSTTNFLVDEIRKHGKPVYRVRNAISSNNIKFFETINYLRKGRPSPFVVGYYSGTKTHQADFAVAAPALIQFMHENTDVIFRLVGDFELGDWPELAHWQHIHRAGDLPRVTRVGLMPHDAMVRDQLSCDLIMAPLEVGNPFCEAKSELKFFEASLAQCPVIASATQSFVEATQNGRLAHVVHTVDEWLHAFREIYDNYPIALKRVRAAFDDVRYHYAQRFAANEALDAYEDYAVRFRGAAPRPGVTALDALADIGVVLPDFSGPSGGHRKIFAICKEFEQRGKTLKLYFYTGRSPQEIKRDLNRFFGGLNAEVVTFFGEIEAHTYVICTQWKTAYDFRKVDYAGKILYFVQDFEPMFVPVGSDYMRALVSYSLGFDVICYGEWIAAKLQDELGLVPKRIPFTLDHVTYGRPAEEGVREIDVLVFARPSQDRRCIDLIVEGLVDLKHRRPEIRISLFGEDEYEDFGFEFTSHGSISDLTELAALYRQAKVGICYSPTNPSQLGYEMVACGVNLIDVRVKFAELNFDNDSFVRYCQGTPESMSAACVALLDDPAERSERQKNGYSYVARMPSDDTLGAAFIHEAGIR